MQPKEPKEGPTALDLFIVQSILKEYEADGDPLVNYKQGTLCLNAKGRPLRESAVRDLVMETHIVGGETVMRLSTLLKNADLYLARRLARPNLKAAAAKRARAARGKGAVA